MSKLTAVLPEDGEVGGGLALRDDAGRYLFFLAGSKFDCPPGELFYGGIGGHLEPGEDPAACVHREAAEEIGAEITLRSAPETFHLPDGSPARRIAVEESPAPLAVYEMIHPEGTERAGESYHIVVFDARLDRMTGDLAAEEVSAVLGLRREQVVRGPERRPTIDALLDEGAALVAEARPIDTSTVVYPVGTARALATVLDRIEDR